MEHLMYGWRDLKTSGTGILPVKDRKSPMVSLTGRTVSQITQADGAQAKKEKEHVKGKEEEEEEKVEGEGGDKGGRENTGRKRTRRKMLSWMKGERGG
ncbi:hypothetical protein PoB_005035700 [Plakobranchus ocellatus]|uniref:Uncharacterized protein n=1 Tax=Plakobranchus ocellatus TaxID=259542 RepID=A0AAV4BXT8_9GAST|nr:hypothetical protein PoB_005035700 [Plakobranchus ocellatus]